MKNSAGKSLVEGRKLFAKKVVDGDTKQLNKGNWTKTIFRSMEGNETKTFLFLCSLEVFSKVRCYLFSGTMCDSSIDWMSFQAKKKAKNKFKVSSTPENVYFAFLIHNIVYNIQCTIHIRKVTSSLYVAYTVLHPLFQHKNLSSLSFQLDLPLVVFIMLANFSVRQLS